MRSEAVLPTPAVQGTPVPAGPPPPDYLGEQWELLLGPRADTAPPGKKIGDVEQDAKATYSKVCVWCVCECGMCVVCVWHVCGVCGVCVWHVCGVCGVACE